VPFVAAVFRAGRVPFVFAVLLAITPSPAFYFGTLSDISQKASDALEDLEIFRQAI